eukprot:Pgem_evm1s9447
MQFNYLTLASLASLCIGINGCKLGNKYTEVDKKLSDDLKLNEITVLATHNSYHKKSDPKLLELLALMESEFIGTNSNLQFHYAEASISDQLRQQNIRSFEFDIAYDPEGGLFAKHQGLQMVLKMDNISDSNPAMYEPGYKVFHVQGIS